MLLLDREQPSRNCLGRLVSRQCSRLGQRSFEFCFSIGCRFRLPLHLFLSCCCSASTALRFRVSFRCRLCLTLLLNLRNLRFVSPPPQLLPDAVPLL